MNYEPMEFTVFKEAVSKQFDKMAAGQLFVSKATKDQLWDTYLSSFPEGTNPIFRERTEHDCNCCKQFVRAVGNVLAIIDDELVSIWDINIGGYYQVVADAMSALVKKEGINTVFASSERSIGTDHNTEVGTGIVWNHFHQVLPNKFVSQDVGAIKGKARDHYNALRRSLDEISSEAIEIVRDLITQNSLYRGREHLGTVNALDKHKTYYKHATNKEHYLWLASVDLGRSSAFRNTVIGTLLCDISNGRELESAVKSFEDKVAPANYKRPSALITKGMIAKAEEKIVELGCAESLPRRMAVTEDITINNVLFADRSVQKQMGVLGCLDSEAKTNLPNLDKVEEVTIDKFISDILPKADSIELSMANNHANNLMTLVAPVNAHAEPILDWGNNFSWSYNGELADSVKERVKKAGGKVDGDLRISLSWFNTDDLDLHLDLPCGNVIYFGNDRFAGGKLDVDMNASGCRLSKAPVENITWADKRDIPEGTFTVKVHQYSKRNSSDGGFDLEMEFGGKLYTFSYDKMVRGGQKVKAVTFKYTRMNGIEIVESIPSNESSIDLWGVPTNQFHKVNMIMNSPNHWDGNENGNKHWFFIMDGCVNPDPVRGFYNEFLRKDLMEHRKVFEVLGSKMKPEHSDNQLSGLGFSDTQRNEVLCKVTGAFNRIIKIKF